MGKQALALLAGLSLSLGASQARGDDLTQLEGLLEEPVVSTASLAAFCTRGSSVV